MRRVRGLLRVWGLGVFRVPGFGLNLKSRLRIHAVDFGLAAGLRIQTLSPLPHALDAAAVSTIGFSQA